jgi:iron complex transport system substrate-binding protein
MVVVLFFLGATIVAGQAQPVEHPKRIVCIVPAVTVMLFDIGAGSQVVGVSSFERFPPEATKLPAVGALLDPDTERILSLRPDLVIVYGSQTDLRAQLERARIPMFVYSHAGLADVTVTLRGSEARRACGQCPARRQHHARIGAVRLRRQRSPKPRTHRLRPRAAVAARHLQAAASDSSTTS